MIIVTMINISYFFEIVVCDQFGYSALYLAVVLGKTDIVKLLLGVEAIDFNYKDQVSFTLLL